MRSYLSTKKRQHQDRTTAPTWAALAPLRGSGNGGSGMLGKPAGRPGWGTDCGFRPRSNPEARALAAPSPS